MIVNLLSVLFCFFWCLAACFNSYFRASLIAQLVKNLSAIRRPWFNSWVSKICWRRNRLPTPVFLGFLVTQLVKNPPWIGNIPWRREWLPTPVFWPREFHELYSPLCRKESDTTEWLPLSLHAYAICMIRWYDFHSVVKLLLSCLTLWPYRL